MKLTQEQLAEIIAKVFASIEAKRKAKMDAGESVPDEITTEELMAELAAVLDGQDGGDGGEGAPEGTEGKDGKGEADLEALIEQIMKIAGGMKSAGCEGEQKADGGHEPPPAEPAPGEQKSGGPSSTPAGGPGAAPAQRKYVNLFLGGSGRGSIQQNGFAARIATMSGPERRKAAYGMFGRSVKCIHASGGDIERAAFIAERKFSDAEMAHEFKALAVTSPTDGGYLVPEVYSKEIIELLYPSTVIYALGARKLGMANGNLNIPKIKTGARAMFTGEGRIISKSSPKFGNVKLSAKKLTALIPMSNDLLRSTNFDNDVIVGQDVTRQMALGVDWGAILGSGGEFQPLGIVNNKQVYKIDVTKLDKEHADADGHLTAAFPNFMVAAVLRNNVFADGLGFTFNTSVEQYFKSLRDQVGGFIFAEEMNKSGTLAGYPYRTTNLLETVNGRTQIIFGNWNDLVIGEQGALEIKTSEEGTWTDDAGNLISAFENDQTLIRAINNVDTGLRHDESFAVASNVAVPV